MLALIFLFFFLFSHISFPSFPLLAVIFLFLFSFLITLIFPFSFVCNFSCLSFHSFLFLLTFACRIHSYISLPSLLSPSPTYSLSDSTHVFFTLLLIFVPLFHSFSFLAPSTVPSLFFPFFLFLNVLPQFHFFFFFVFSSLLFPYFPSFFHSYISSFPSLSLSQPSTVPSLLFPFSFLFPNLLYFLPSLSPTFCSSVPSFPFFLFLKPSSTVPALLSHLSLLSVSSHHQHPLLHTSAYWFSSILFYFLYSHYIFLFLSIHFPLLPTHLRLSPLHLPFLASGHRSRPRRLSLSYVVPFAVNISKQLV